LASFLAIVLSVSLLLFFLGRGQISLNSSDDVDQISPLPPFEHASFHMSRFSKPSEGSLDNLECDGRVGDHHFSTYKQTKMPAFAQGAGLRQASVSYDAYESAHDRLRSKYALEMDFKPYPASMEDKGLFFASQRTTNRQAQTRPSTANSSSRVAMSGKAASDKEARPQSALFRATRKQMNSSGNLNHRFSLPGKKGARYSWDLFSHTRHSQMSLTRLSHNLKAPTHIPAFAAKKKERQAVMQERALAKTRRLNALAFLGQWDKHYRSKNVLAESMRSLQ
jgi:hypothetical protein